MNAARDIFLTAARDHKAAHIGVHMDRKTFEEMWPYENVCRGFLRAAELGNVLAPHIPSLWTTLTENLAFPFRGEHDLITRAPTTPSAIRNPVHMGFIRDQHTSVALISGFTASKCVEETRQHCIEEGITPIMVMDATDLYAPDTGMREHLYDNFRASATRVWGDECLTATVGEVRSWVGEIEEHHHS